MERLVARHASVIASAHAVASSLEREPQLLPRRGATHKKGGVGRLEAGHIGYKRLEVE